MRVVRPVGLVIAVVLAGVGVWLFLGSFTIERSIEVTEAARLPPGVGSEPAVTRRRVGVFIRCDRDGSGRRVTADGSQRFIGIPSGPNSAPEPPERLCAEPLAQRRSLGWAGLAIAAVVAVASLILGRDRSRPIDRERVLNRLVDVEAGF